MWDVVIAGAGPGGSIAATILARAGARVVLVDRARFPRDKLCGDSLNPGTLALLRDLDLSSWVDTHGVPVDGMLLTGPRGVSVEGRYPPPLRGRIAMRRDLDYWLLGQALRAGAQFEEGVAVRGPRFQEKGNGVSTTHVTGVVVSSRRNGTRTIPARVTIAADGRRSTLAFGLGIAHHPVWPRRWAVGAYFEGVSGSSSFGEMHIRAGAYLGVAPLPNGVTNACAVVCGSRLGGLRAPERALYAMIEQDPTLRERFAGARMIARPVVLGPLAVDVRSCGLPGLLLAGDAAGFVDPMTGDGLRFAVRGAQLAAETALEMLVTGRTDGHVSLARRRREAFASKWRFNRALRRIVGMPAAVNVAALGASIAPALVKSLIRFAGDCPNSGQEGSASREADPVGRLEKRDCRPDYS
jgi:flavin-dependent dehydrogenase